MKAQRGDWVENVMCDLAYGIIYWSWGQNRIWYIPISWGPNVHSHQNKNDNILLFLEFRELLSQHGTLFITVKCQTMNKEYLTNISVSKLSVSLLKWVETHYFRTFCPCIYKWGKIAKVNNTIADYMCYTNITRVTRTFHFFRLSRVMLHSLQNIDKTIHVCYIR